MDRKTNCECYFMTMVNWAWVGAWVHPCSCGSVPEFSVYRGGEDFMLAKGVCPKCGLESDEIEHVWGGTEARLMAVAEWNRMRAEEPDKRPLKVCGVCGGVGFEIVGDDYGPACATCKGRGTVNVQPQDSGGPK